MDETYVIREVQKKDLVQLAAIEQKRWEREGTEIMTMEILTQWYETRSPFFLLAEKKGVIEGFYHAIQVDFSLNEIERFTAPEMQTHHGCSIHAHDPQAKSVYAMNVVVIKGGAGAALNAEVHRRLKGLEMLYFIGVPRLVNLDHYLRGVEETHGGLLPYPEEDIALWYAHESMKMLETNKPWQECTAQPDLFLPPLRRPDLLLKFTVTTIRAGLLRIIPNFMKDPKSRNYGAFLASELPHK
jgi:hypothetical protein